MNNIDIVIVDKIISFLDWKDTISFCSCCKYIYRLEKKYENEIWENKIKNKVNIIPLFQIENYKKFHINSELGIGMLIEHILHESNKGILNAEVWKITKRRNKEYNFLPFVFLLGYDKIETTVLYITEFYEYDKGIQKINVTRSLEEAQNYNIKTYLKNIPLNRSIKRVSYKISFYELYI